MIVGCPKCGAKYNHFEEHKCPQIPEKFKIPKKQQETAVRIYEELEEIAVGKLVGVRIQPDLLARLDAARGGMTRPQKIREILEEAL